MKGSFSEEALQQFAKLAAQSQSLEFSESNVYDFTRCVRPDGSAYGTGGKCRKGSEQELFKPDGGIRTDNSGGIISGRLFGAEQPYKNLYGDLKQSIEDSKKLGFARNKEKVDALIKVSNTLLKKELEVMRKGGKDNTHSNLYEGLVNALDKVLAHGDRYDLARMNQVRKVRDSLFEEGVFRQG